MDIVLRDNDMSWLSNLSMITAVVCVIVIIAMSIDLASGLYKASIRGERKTSFGLQRTTLKCITYLGSVLICFGVDVLVHMGKLWESIGWHWMIGIPVFAIMLGIFNCVVELFSVREKADSKADKRALKNVLSIIKGLRQSELTELLAAFEELKNNAEKKDVEQ